jgi:single-strand DNA-binding protein
MTFLAMKASTVIGQPLYYVILFFVFICHIQNNNDDATTRKGFAVGFSMISSSLSPSSISTGESNSMAFSCNNNWSSFYCQKYRMLYSSSSSYEEHVNIDDEEEEDYENDVDEEADDDDMMTDEDLLASAGAWDEKVAKYNVIHLTGRVGSVYEIKHLDEKKVVISLSMASTRKYHWLENKYRSDPVNNNNNNLDDTDWYTLEVWGQKAEFIQKFVDKGTRISVIGQLLIDTWTDKEHERNLKLLSGNWKY